MKVIIKNLQKKIPVYPGKIKKTILRALKSEGLNKRGEITISLVTDSCIARLNAKYRGKNRSTDVLAFDLSPALNPGMLLADIIVSADTAQRNAKVFKTTSFYEMNLYSLHGLLHLLGFTDSRRKNILVMRKKESQYVHP